ncbi:MAG: hypothetical protein KGK30_05585, partial [Elusimicrobia bacterium]|nr:hypothetical protein [Elusimicrobiota bacterium]
MKRLGLAIALCGLSVQARPQTIEDAAQENLPRVGDANPGYNYDIFGTGHDCDETGNCHNKTDEFLAAAWARHMKAGALVCQEDPRTDPRYHTAVWLVLAHGKACI